MLKNGETIQIEISRFNIKNNMNKIYVVLFLSFSSLFPLCVFSFRSVLLFHDVRFYSMPVSIIIHFNPHFSVRVILVWWPYFFLQDISGPNFSPNISVKFRGPSSRLPSRKFYFITSRKESHVTYLFTCVSDVGH